jgi:hypothetical protein
LLLLLLLLLLSLIKKFKNTIITIEEKPQPHPLLFMEFSVTGHSSLNINCP